MTITINNYTEETLNPLNEYSDEQVEQIKTNLENELIKRFNRELPGAVVEFDDLAWDCYATDGINDDLNDWVGDIIETVFLEGDFWIDAE